jgi:hypothetical protein
VAEILQQQVYTLKIPSLNVEPELPSLPPNNDPRPELEAPVMASALEDNTTSPSRLKILRDQNLQAYIKPIIEPRLRGDEEEGDSTKARAAPASTQEASVIYVSQ